MQKSLAGKQLSDYEQAIKEFCDTNKDATVYLAGEISHPGISDLDFLIVNKRPIVTKNVETFLAGGNVIVMPDFLMQKVRNFENFNLKLLQGHDYHIDDPHKYFNIVEIIEWLPERLLKLASLGDSAKKQDVLLVHKSINRSVKAVTSLTGVNIDIIEADLVRAETCVDIQILVIETLKYAKLAWDIFEEFLFDNNFVSGDVNGQVGISPYYSFSDKFTSLMIYFKRVSGIKNNELSKSLDLRCSLNGSGRLDEDFDKYIVDRWNDINKIFVWFKNNNIDRGMIKYGWFL